MLSAGQDSRTKKSKSFQGLLLLSPPPPPPPQLRAPGLNRSLVGTAGLQATDLGGHCRAHAQTPHLKWQFLTSTTSSRA